MAQPQSELRPHSTSDYRGIFPGQHYALKGTVWFHEDSEKTEQECLMGPDMAQDLGFNTETTNARASNAEVSRATMSGTTASNARIDDLRTYQYSPLEAPESIRLLQISNSDDGQLAFEFASTTLDSAASFEAVSYTWGSEDRDSSIKHVKTGDVIYVTRNCEAALRSLASNVPRTVWIDAVCINQDDIAERNRQIRLMGQIFRSASLTIAYIGQSDKSSSVLSLWCRKEGLDQSGSFTEESEVSEDYDSSDDHLTQFTNAASDLQDRSWFTRTWVIQEVLLSRRLVVQAGIDRIDWMAFRRLQPGRGGVVDLKAYFSAKSLGKRMYKGSNLKRSASWDELWGDRQIQPRSFMKLLSTNGLIDFGHLFDLMCETSSYGCTDPRDKLFAVLSLFQGPIPAGLEPDYSRSIEDVFTNISRFLLCYGVVKSLSAARGVGGDSLLPTWTIDWRIARDEKYRGVQWFRSKNALEWYSALDHPRAGFMDGSRKTRVRSKGDQCLSIRGKTIESDLKVEQVPFREARHLFMKEQWLRSCSWKIDHEQPVSIIKRGEEVGVVPVQTKASDVICIFLGVRVPFVLRSIEKGWQVVGECRVPWAMEGQELNDIDWNTAYNDEPTMPVQDFDLY